MAGIGDYTKNGKFTLKSGNKPAFKMMGSNSPYKNVGEALSAVADALPDNKNTSVDKRSAKEKAEDKANASKNKENNKTANNEGGDKKGKFGKFMGKHGGDIIAAIGDALPKYN